MQDKNQTLVALIKMAKNRMFPLSLNVCNLKCLKASIETDLTFWHLRYGHLNYKSLDLLKLKGIVAGMPKIQKSKQMCEEYVKGKQQRSTFPSKGIGKTAQRLELVYLDVCRLITSASMSGNRNILTFINDYSGKTLAVKLIK